MITVRRAGERHLDGLRKREVWHTFHPRQRAGETGGGFEGLELLEEDRLPPGSRVPPHLRRHGEVVTYVREGALAFEDTSGHSGVIRAGEFERSDARRGVSRRSANASRTDWAHVFQVWLRAPAFAKDLGPELRRFSAAERRGGLCLVASPDARRGSLRLVQDTLLLSALLDSGHHLVHALSPGRSAWLHVVHGAVTLDDVSLVAGDGAGVRGERAVSLTARGVTEILLVDLGERPPLSGTPSESMTR